MTAAGTKAEKSIEEMTDAEFESLLIERRGRMRGLELTSEQRRKAEEYRGSIDHGSDEFRKR